jgi:dTDP-4-amino-4,6-dideoxygalactose transaminase
MAGWRIPLTDLDYDQRERTAALGPLDDRWLSMGPEVEAFEREFAELVGVNHAIAVASGTAALHLAFLALDVSAGDEVVQPAMNFVAAANMTLAVGAAPVFADIVAVDDPTVSPRHVEALIGPRTRAVVVMHYGGAACRMREITAIARARGVAVVEDACHAVGATYGPVAGPDADRAVGSVGDLACFSFFSNKNLATGEGGMVVTSDARLAEHVRLLRSHGMTTLTWDRFQGQARGYDVVAPGFNYRLDDLRAALGRVQLAKLPDGTARRRARVEQYRARLAGRSSLGFVHVDRAATSAHHLMVLVAPDAETRELVTTALHAVGIQTSMHYPCVTDFAAFAGSSCSDVPVSRTFAARAFTVPLHPNLDPGVIDEIAEILVDAAPVSPVAAPSEPR